jgi:hypothetical protein
MESNLVLALRRMTENASNDGRFTYFSILRNLKKTQKTEKTLPMEITLDLMWLAKGRKGTKIASAAIIVAGHYMMNHKLIPGIIGKKRENVANKAYIKYAISRAYLHYGASKDSRRGLMEMEKSLKHAGLGDLAARDLYDYVVDRDFMAMAGIKSPGMLLGANVRAVVKSRIPTRERDVRRLARYSGFITGNKQSISILASRMVRKGVRNVRPALDLRDCDDWNFPSALYRLLIYRPKTKAASEAIETIVAVAEQLRKQKQAGKCRLNWRDICGFHGISRKDLRLYRAELMLFGGTPRYSASAAKEIGSFIGDRSATRLRAIGKYWGLKFRQKGKYAAALLYFVKTFRERLGFRKQLKQIKVDTIVLQKAEASLTPSERSALNSIPYVYPMFLIPTY